MKDYLISQGINAISPRSAFVTMSSAYVIYKVNSLFLYMTRLLL